MFKPKKQIKPLPVKSKQEVEDEIEEVEEIEDEIEDEDEESDDEEEEIEEEEEAPVKKTIKTIKNKKSTYSVGDIIPIQQIVGYQIVKSISSDGQPIVVSTEKISEAEILSFIYQQ